MHIKLNNATIDLDGLDLDSMDAEDVKPLTRDTARLYPAEALNEALAVFRGSDSSTSLHATLDALDTIRRDLPDWLTTGVIYEDRAGRERGERPLTDDERRRIAEAVGAEIAYPDPPEDVERRHQDTMDAIIWAAMPLSERERSIRMAGQ